MSAPLYLDIHVLQSVPPSNINRDDTGSPKQATYGGVPRLRASSQSLKRAARTKLAKSQPEESNVAFRTKRIVGMLKTRLIAAFDLDEDRAQAVAKSLLEGTEIKLDKREKRDSDSAYLLFFGSAQLDDAIARIAASGVDVVEASDADLKALGKTALVEALRTGHPLDVALFGRMVADLGQLKLDASVQVAHAIATHATNNEYDYFTAVDDENPADETGAGMIGTVEFASATLYRYATVAVHQLEKNLGGPDHVAEGVRRFVDAFTTTLPSGKENSFGHHTRPALVFAVLRDSAPVNLVTAFERAVQPTVSGYEAASVRALIDEHLAEKARWGDASSLEFASYKTTGGDAPSAFPQSIAYADLLQAIERAISDRLNTTGRQGDE